MPMCRKCGNKFPNRVVIEGETKVLNKRKYCLDCSPFGRHNTKQLVPSPDKLLRKCSRCGETDHTKFYGNKKTICGKCHSYYTSQKGREKRAYAIEKLGGKCKACGFDRYPCSLDIHHVDPSIKDSNFDSMRGWSYERIDKEIKGCILLCKNCHSAYHSGYGVTW